MSKAPVKAASPAKAAPPPPKPAAVIEEEEEDEAPGLEAADDDLTPDAHAGAHPGQAGGRSAAGKQPKRYAKAMAKLGSKPEGNILRVQIRKHNGMSFSIAKPEVYRFPGTNTFVIFGETNVEEANNDQQKAAARTVTGAATAAATTPAAAPTAADTKGGAAKKPAAAATPAAGEPEGEVDKGDLQEKEIEIVMTQASVTRAKAITALKNNKGDIVNAIMELTM